MNCECSVVVNSSGKSHKKTTEKNGKAIKPESLNGSSHLFSNGYFCDAASSNTYELLCSKFL